VCPFYRDREGVGASGGGGGINASHFDIERKKGGSGEGRRFSGECRLVGVPATEEDGGEARTAACGGTRPGWRLGPA
jgi:hypothetical protein